MFDSNSQSYTTTNTIARNVCTYDAYKKLKTHLDANDPSDTATSWGTPRTEDYTYDANFDYLTGYRFDAGAWTTNTYDAAGNRNDATSVDCLNRATTMGGTTRTYDILGNTLTMGATKSMGWDVLNRMTSFTSSGATTAYAYRADGLRVKKRGPGASPTTTYYRYDGQMPVEEFNYRIVYPISYIKILRYAFGARGIDRVERVPTNGATLVGYPLYDAHGNNIATLTIDHANHFSVPASDKRSYGPWGDIRTGATTGEPQPRHCANLGHLSDDESGFVYMRARYYEPGSGRFISEDPAGQGMNWFAYCGNNPVGRVDESGKSWGSALTSFLVSLVSGTLALLITQSPLIGLLVGSAVSAILSGPGFVEKTLPAWINSVFKREISVLASTEVQVAEHTHAGAAVDAYAAEAGRAEGEIMAMEIEELGFDHVSWKF